MKISELKVSYDARLTGFLHELGRLSTYYGVLVIQPIVWAVSNKQYDRTFFSYEVVGDWTNNRMDLLCKASRADESIPRYTLEQETSDEIHDFVPVRRIYKTIDAALKDHAYCTDHEHKDYLLVIGKACFALAELSEIRDIPVYNYAILSVCSGKSLGGLPPIIQSYELPAS